MLALLIFSLLFFLIFAYLSYGKKIAKAFAKASALVRESSMEINAEFDQLIDEEAI